MTGVVGPEFQRDYRVVLLVCSRSVCCCCGMCLVTAAPPSTSHTPTPHSNTHADTHTQRERERERERKRERERETHTCTHTLSLSLSLLCVFLSLSFPRWTHTTPCHTAPRNFYFIFPPSTGVVMHYFFWHISFIFFFSRVVYALFPTLYACLAVRSPPGVMRVCVADTLRPPYPAGVRTKLREFFAQVCNFHFETSIVGFTFLGAACLHFRQLQTEWKTARRM